ncbi:MAG TPA: ATPase domain-containing protein [Candidatus Binatia bacterium]|jgi:RecA/RadA recombinase
MSRGSADASALRDLLLVPGILRGLAARESPARIPTGVDALDALLGGGLPRGALTEIVGRPSAGRTTLACTFLRAVTAHHALAACIDPHDTLDASHTESAGVDLSRVLWVRPRTARDALRAALHVLDADGFALVLVDLDGAGVPGVVPASVWMRLTRAALRTRTAMVVLARENVAGTFAALRLEVERRQVVFDGPPSHALLGAVTSAIHLRKSKLGAPVPHPAVTVARS